MVEVPKGSTGGGATIPSTLNLIAGDGAGNGADSRIVPSNVSLLSTLPADFATTSAASPAGGTFTGLSMSPDGAAFGSSGGGRPSISSFGIEIASGGSVESGAIKVQSGSGMTRIVNGQVALGGAVAVAWCSGNPASIAPDVGLVRSDTNILQLNNASTGGAGLFCLNMFAPATPTGGAILYTNSGLFYVADTFGNDFQVAPQDLSSGGSPVFVNSTLTALTANRFVATNNSGLLTSVRAMTVTDQTDVTGKTATFAILSSSSPPAANYFALIGVYIKITAISAGTLTITVAFHDEANASQTVTLFPMGLTSAGLTTTGYTAFAVPGIKCFASTGIIITATFAGVSITYDAGAFVQVL